MAAFTTSGTAASAPTETSDTAAACLNVGLILSAIRIPIPKPNAARVSESKPSKGISSAAFGMDIESGIAYR
ncbi:MAG: hypothetical protein ACJ8IQ_02640 [Chthoniobacterales bacterium]